MLEISVSCGKCDRQKQRRMAQLGQKPHGFKDLDFLMVLGNAAVVFGAKWTPVASQTVRVCAPQWGSQSWLPSGFPAGAWTCWKACPQARLPARSLFSRNPRACPSERSDCIGGAGFSLSTPARGRISSQSRIPADSVTGTASGRVISHKAVSGQQRGLMVGRAVLGRNRKGNRLGPVARQDLSNLGWGRLCNIALRAEYTVDPHLPNAILCWTEAGPTKLDDDCGVDAGVIWS